MTEADEDAEHRLAVLTSWALFGPIGLGMVATAFQGRRRHRRRRRLRDPRRRVHLAPRHQPHLRGRDFRPGEIATAASSSGSASSPSCRSGSSIRQPFTQRDIDIGVVGLGLVAAGSIRHLPHRPPRAERGILDVPPASRPGRRTADVTEAAIWLLAFLALYWRSACSGGWRQRGFPAARRASFSPTATFRHWVMVAAGTAFAFNGWMFRGTPDLIFRDGLAVRRDLPRRRRHRARLGLLPQACSSDGSASASAMSRRGRWPATIIGGEAIRLAVVVIALVFAVPFVAMQNRRIAGSPSSRASRTAPSIATSPCGC